MKYMILTQASQLDYDAMGGKGSPSGDVHAARDAYEAAARRPTNLAQHRYLRSRAAGTV